MSFVNGVHGKTGRYLTSPFAESAASLKLHGGALDPASERYHRWRQERYSINSVDRGLEEGIDPLDLAAAGWGVIFAPDIGKEVKDKLRPLLKLREEQAKGLFRKISYPAKKTSKVEFLADFGVRAGPVNPEHLPYYLLLVGDPGTIPFEFQYQLDVQYAVGRIHFEDSEDYGRYADAVAQAENREVPLPAREVALFAGRHEGDQATKRMTAELIEPLKALLRAFDKQRNPNPWPVRLLLAEQATKDQLRRLLGSDQKPALLVTATHGLSFPSGDPLQQSAQGALVCQDWPGPSEMKKPVDPAHYFAARDLDHNPALHGLIAVHYACFSAGTPQQSSYDHPRSGKAEQLAWTPFISQLSQKLLSCGALAVLGHVDRSWTSSFTWEHAGDTARAFDNTIRRLIRGHPVGWAMEYMNQQYAELSVELSQRWEARHHLSDGSRKSFDRLWQANNDARNFVVIGDPAVRLDL